VSNPYTGRQRNLGHLTNLMRKISALEQITGEGIGFAVAGVDSNSRLYVGNGFKPTGLANFSYVLQQFNTDGGQRDSSEDAGLAQRLVQSGDVHYFLSLMTQVNAFNGVLVYNVDQATMNVLETFTVKPTYVPPIIQIVRVQCNVWPVNDGNIRFRWIWADTSGKLTLAAQNDGIVEEHIYNPEGELQSSKITIYSNVFTRGWIYGTWQHPLLGDVQFVESDVSMLPDANARLAISQTVSGAYIKNGLNAYGMASGLRVWNDSNLSIAFQYTKILPPGFYYNFNAIRFINETQVFHTSSSVESETGNLYGFYNVPTFVFYPGSDPSVPPPFSARFPEPSKLAILPPTGELVTVSAPVNNYIPIVGYDGSLYSLWTGQPVEKRNAETLELEETIDLETTTTARPDPWYRYGRFEKVDIGQFPDRGTITRPFQNPDEIDLVSIEYIRDLRTRVEALANSGRFQNPATSNDLHFTNEDEDNLYYVAMGDRSAYGATGGPRYTWTRSIDSMINTPTYDIDIGEIYECVSLLEGL